MKSMIVCFALIAVALADKLSPDQQVPIISQSSDVRPDGYEFAFESGNGIAAQEQAVLVNVGKENEGISVQGAAKWQSPEGQNFELKYTADENGYVPVGDHLPVAPPVPEAILRALAWAETHPYKEE